MSEMAIGAVLALCVVLLTVAVAGGMAWWQERQARQRHVELRAEFDGIRRTMSALVTQYGRLDGEVRDLREVVADHAERLDRIAPGATLARRPKP